ncbi:sulfite exporter TauE/SafE family protein [Pseudogemmobacter bohemicus]|uniref:sulfite exporter TauE/SafE family protein n=1 Tax=Pseudogemmobacter bohemicus TaxID=2250708 RepID=UPI001E4E7C91|nr:sulfite exporter TauE/SafE family protein [Pseudogemmobacter bohemicus]
MDVQIDAGIRVQGKLKEALTPLDTEAILLSAAFLVIALVYAAVGQAGASGYIAAMALFGFAPMAMKTTALTLNLLVAAIGTVHFLKAGRLSWRNVYPFALLGFPFSILGGAIHLPEDIYYPVVGIVLVLSALQMGRSALRKGTTVYAEPVAPPFLAALATGAVIGFVSGTTGTGGGVFLAPVILAMNWATAHQTAATTALYNLMNSAAALLGAYAFWDQLPTTTLPWWLIAVAVGGSLGAFVGSRYLSDRWLRGILAVLLLVSGVKLLW